MTPLAEKFIKYAYLDAKKVGDKYNIRCPICGDSKKNKRKRRFWFIENNKKDYVHCFNCDYSSSFYKFFKENCPEFFDSYRNELRQNSFKSLTGESLDDLVFEDLPPIIEKEPEEEVIDDFENPFQEIDSEAIEYLEKRKVLSEIKRRNIQVYQAKNLNVFDMYLDNFIIFPLLREDGTWFGFQGRSLVGKQFITKLFDESLPKAWNIFQTDKTKEVFVCESIFDALSTGQDNSMAVLGSSSEILSKYKRDYVICLDNYNFDMKAKQSYRKYVDEGFKAFMWPKEIEYKDFNEMLVNGNFKPEQIKILINENIEEGLPAQVTLRF